MLTYTHATYTTAATFTNMSYSVPPTFTLQQRIALVPQIPCQHLENVLALNAHHIDSQPVLTLQRRALIILMIHSSYRHLPLFIHHSLTQPLSHRVTEPPERIRNTARSAAVSDGSAPHHRQH